MSIFINQPVRRRTAIFPLIAFINLFLLASAPLLGQQRVSKLPSADKVIAAYLKAIGGKKRIASARQASESWRISDGGNGETSFKAPGLFRLALSTPTGGFEIGVNGSTAWWRQKGLSVTTLTGREANDAKLAAILITSRMLEYKKSNVLARTVEYQSGSEPTYVLAFSMRNGAMILASFNATSKLLTSLKTGDARFEIRFDDYKANGQLLEPQRITLIASEAQSVTLIKQPGPSNVSLTAPNFDPPPGSEAIDVPALLKEVEQNQKRLDERIGEYTYIQKETEREINDKGDLKKESVKVYEVYPVPGRTSVLKLVSENGKPLSDERIEKEQRRVAGELEKAERERQKEKEKLQREEDRKKAGGASTRKDSDDRDPGISAFFKVCEFVSPRRELLSGREVIVFDFRPRPNFKPSNREESIISKLVGIVWIDPQDKEVMRLEARLAEGFKLGGGLVLSLRPGAAIVIEQTRMADGVWLPKFAQANLSYKLFLFAGGEVNKTYEWSDYKRFNAEAGDYKLNPPK
jgi:outer membrane lipoprotein-sorting protein